MSYGRTTISRQFTDAEQAIDERLTSHLQAPPVQMQIGDRISQSYRWMNEDLKLRSELSGQLAQEQAMAYSQSSRHELARQSVVEEAERAEALQGISRMRQMIESGEAKDWGDAGYKVGIESEGLVVNDDFNKFYQDGARMVDPATRQFEEKRRSLEMLKMEDAFDDVMIGREVRDAIPRGERIRSYTQAMENSLNSPFAEEKANKLKELSYIHATRMAEEQERHFQMYGSDPTSASSRMMLTGMLAEAGIQDTGDLKNLALYAKGNQPALAALNDITWQAATFKTPEEKEAYLAAWSAVGNSDPASPEFQKARQILDAHTYRYMRDTEMVSSLVAKVNQANELATAIGINLKDVYKEQLDLAKLNPEDNPDAPKMMLSTVTRLLAEMKGKVSPQTAEVYENAVSEQMAKLDKKTSAADMLQVVRTLTMNLMGAAQAEQSALLGVTAADVAAQRQPAIPEDTPRMAPEMTQEEKQALYDSLPDGASYVSPSGDLLIKGQEPK